MNSFSVILFAALVLIYQGFNVNATGFIPFTYIDYFEIGTGEAIQEDTNETVKIFGTGPVPAPGPVIPPPVCKSECPDLFSRVEGGSGHCTYTLDEIMTFWEALDACYFLGGRIYSATEPSSVYHRNVDKNAKYWTAYVATTLALVVDDGFNDEKQAAEVLKKFEASTKYRSVHNLDESKKFHDSDWAKSSRFKEGPFVVLQVNGLEKATSDMHRLVICESEPRRQC